MERPAWTKRQAIAAILIFLLLGMGAIAFIVNANATSQKLKTVLGGLSQEQMLEDATYLWDVLDREYPYSGTIRRKGYGYNAIRDIFMTHVAQAQDDAEFLAALDQLNSEMHGVGHFTAFTLKSFELFVAYRDLFNSESMMPGISLSMHAWADYINNPAILARYANFEEITGKPVALTSQAQNLPPETKIIRDGEVAYIKLSTFYRRDDHDMLQEFWNEVAAYDHLIIDIRQNGGGYGDYWPDSIVAPNIERPLTRVTYSLFAQTERNREFVENIGAYLGSEVQPITKEIADLVFYKDDVPFFTHYVLNSTTVEPSGAQPLFSGKVWLLVDSRVYSAAEGLAIFCKETGFATLVGQTTRGDSGENSIFMTLPNSLIIAQFRLDYTLGSTGVSSVEAGTVPDILVKQGQDALDVCLQAIDDFAATR